MARGSTRKLIASRPPPPTNTTIPARSASPGRGYSLSGRPQADSETAWRRTYRRSRSAIHASPPPPTARSSIRWRSSGSPGTCGMPSTLALAWRSAANRSGASTTRRPLFVDVSPDAEILRREVFGPVLTLQTFDTEAEAIALANSTDYRLAATMRASIPPICVMYPHTGRHGARPDTGEIPRATERHGARPDTGGIPRGRERDGHGWAGAVGGRHRAGREIRLLSGPAPAPGHRSAACQFIYESNLRTDMHYLPFQYLTGRPWHSAHAPHAPHATVPWIRLDWQVMHRRRRSTQPSRPGFDARSSNNCGGTPARLPAGERVSPVAGADAGRVREG